jgi:hypothetical protein
VSDDQVDRSQTERPAVKNAVNEARPSPDPCSVMLADPVAARFVLPATLTITASSDWLTVTVPSRVPTVDTIRRLPAAPWPVWHRTDVSASHAVSSHDVTPVRAPAVKPACPMLAPCRVTLDDPVATRFVRLMTLIAPKSAEPAASVTLPTFMPAVSETALLPATPCPSKQRTAVSAAHVVLSHAVRPQLTDDV